MPHNTISLTRISESKCLIMFKGLNYCPKDQHLCSSRYWCLAIHLSIGLPLFLARYCGKTILRRTVFTWCCKLWIYAQNTYTFCIVNPCQSYRSYTCYLKSYHLIFSLEYIFSYWWSYSVFIVDSFTIERNVLVVFEWKILAGPGIIICF